MSNKKSAVTKKSYKDFYKKDKGILTKLNPEKRHQLIGEVTSLLILSEIHHKFLINDIATSFFPPLHLNQFKLYKNKEGNPVALVTWAFLSKEAEKKHINHQMLDPEDWNSGDRIWFINTLAPLGHFKQVYKDLKENVFPDKMIKTIRITKDAKLKGVSEFYGVNYKKPETKKSSKKRKS